MPLLADRVRETTTTTGQGTLTLDGAPSGFRTFTGAFGNGASVYYVIAGPSEWEIGFGTTGAGTLTRDTVLVSSAGGTTKVTFSAGTKDVFCSYVADRAVTTSDAATLTNKTIDDYTNNVGANSTHFRIKASGTLAKGTVVKAVGFTPGEQAIEVAATSSASDVALGISEQALTTGQFGMAVVIGELFDVNTNGLAVGATLYSNNAGSYTTTKPSSGLYQSLGWVVRANLNNGVIAVNVVAPLYVETSTNTANTAVLRDGSGNFAANAGLFGNGTVGAPALAASADTNTGIYFPAADTLGFVTNGAERMRLDNTGGGTSSTLLLFGSSSTGVNRIRFESNDARASNVYQTGSAGLAPGGLILETETDRSILFRTFNTSRWEINSSGHFLAATDASFDIGASGANRPRDLFLGRNATVAGVTTLSAGTVSAPALTTSADTNTGLYFPEADALAFTTGGTARMRIGATGDVAVDTDTLYVDATNNRVSVGASALSASNNYGVPQLGTNSDAFSTFHVETHNNTAGNYSFIGLMRSRGTRAAPTHVQNGDPIGNLDAQVYNDAGSFPYRRSAAIQFVASGNHAVGSLPTDIAFLTTPSGSNSPSERMRLDASGNLGLGTTSVPGSQRLRVAGGDVGLEGQYLYLVNANASVQLGAAQNARITNTDSTNTLDISRTGASSVITLSTAGAERWRINSSGHLLAGADATYDIGASGATRPRDLFLSRNMVGGGWMRAGAASAGAASTTTIGSTTSTTVGATGAASALPANPLGYIVAHVGTTEVRIPYYNA